MERPGQWRVVRSLLRTCYAEVLPLDAFVRRLQAGAGAGAEGRRLEPLVQARDPRGYRSLVQRCVVALPAAAKAPPPRLTFQQISGQNDVVARVIKRICEKNKKNVLAFGYALLDEKNCQLPDIPNIYSFLPNNTTETLRQSVLWEIILSRVGDDVMMYVLEHCALFILVAPTCCYQICGQPIYELALRNTKASPVFVRWRHARLSHNVLSAYLHGRRQACRRHLAKTNWRKWKSRRDRPNRTQECSDSSSLTVWGAVEHNSTRSKSLTRTSEYLTTQQGPRLSAVSLLKRKRIDPCKISSKRMKILQREDRTEKKTPDAVPSKSKNEWILDGIGGNVSGVCERLRTVKELIATEYVSRGSDYGIPASNMPRSTLDSQELAFCGKAPELADAKTQFKTWLPKLETNIVGSRSVQMAEAEKSTAEQDPRKHTSNVAAWKRPNTVSPPSLQIERHTLFYCTRQMKECLPKLFVLNRLKRYRAGGQKLVELIFRNGDVPEQPDHLNPVTCSRKKKRLPKRYWCMRHLFQELLQNHVKCPYLAVLKRNCPIWVSEPDEIGSGKRGCEPTGSPDRRSYSGVSSRVSEKAELSQAEAKVPACDDSSRFLVFLQQHSSHWQVYGFVRECLNRVVPPALFGSNHNKCRFYKNVKRFISLGKFATLPLQEVMWKMRVNDCFWLRLNKESGHFVPASEHRFRETLMSKFLYWLMEAYVAELLRSFFYITETMFQKNLLFFFRKTIWSKLQKIAVSSHLAKVHLRALSKEEIETLQQQKCVPLASKLRFIPKPNGLRPVITLNSVVGAENLRRNKKVQYFNTQLKNLLSVLNYEREKNPSLLGCSVFGKDDIYAVWKKFVLKVLESKTEMSRFYFVKADVTGAFDTIPHSKLVEVVLRILAPDKKTCYRIRRYAAVMRTRNGLIRTCYRRHVSTYKEFIPDVKQFVHHLQESTSLRNAVIVEQSVSLRESSSSLCEFFLQLIHHSVLKIEDRYYVQCCGVPQGSILSTLLCNLCYGDMENKLLWDVQRDGLLMRLTDDFLLVTPHLMQAKAFLRTLAVGIPEYGLVINPRKTVVNFPVEGDIPGCSEFKQLPPCCVIPWCGLLIDMQTLEVYCDYSSYACTSIRSSLSFNSNSKAGLRIRNKLLAVLQLKCHSLFLDSQINSLRTVCINTYKILLLQAYSLNFDWELLGDRDLFVCSYIGDAVLTPGFHACVLRLPFHQQIKNNPVFFLRIICDSASCCYSILEAKNAGVSSAPGPSAPLTFEAVQWLCYHAFSVKLANHRVIYKCLLLPLQHCKMQLLRKIPEASMQLLEEVTKPLLYEDFKAILD